MKKNKIYIAGPVTGIPDYQERFRKAKEKIVAEYGTEQFEYVIPSELCPSHWSWLRSMVKCVWHLLKCQMVVFLPGWEKSKGATIENNIAHRTHKAIRYLPLNYLCDNHIESEYMDD